MSAESEISSQGMSTESNSELLLQLERASEESEQWKQERYELQTQLKRAEAVAKEAEVENELLQASIKEKENKFSQQFIRVQEQHTQEVTRWREKVENLEEMIENMKEEHLKLITQLKQKLSKQEKEIKDNNDSALESKLEGLQIENESLKATLGKKEEELDQLMQENQRQRKLYHEVVETNSELKCFVNGKKEELESTLQCLAELREENALLKQANMVQSAPQDTKKGNSLFAEVEDNRRALKNNLDAVVLKYKRLKKLFQAKCVEVSNVLGEKAALCTQLENARTDQGNFDSQLINSYKDRIKDLENTVKELKQTNKENSIKMISNDYEGLKLVESMLQSSSKEIESLKEQLEERSLNHMLQSELLYTTQRELQVARAQTIKAESELASLKTEIKKEVLSPKENHNLEDEARKPVTPPLKENMPLKTLRFSDDVAPSSKKPVRVTIREISCPQVIITSANNSIR
ncbi:protein Spindly [Anabrus simplex]|uniref:protein Spindly n=1 Tax=Anabrus simplex TaxID=316456 RepID=UPI0035A2AA8A